MESKRFRCDVCSDREVAAAAAPPSSSASPGLNHDKRKSAGAAPEQQQSPAPSSVASDGRGLVMAPLGSPSWADNSRVITACGGTAEAGVAALDVHSESSAR